MLGQGQQKTGKVDQQHSEHITSVGLHIKRVQVFDWPACSPDLLSIEKCADHCSPPVPTLLELVAGIEFKMSEYMQKTKKVHQFELWISCL